MIKSYNKFILFFLLLLSGCDNTINVFLPLYTETNRQLVIEGAAYWDLNVEFVDDPAGVLHIDIFPYPMEIDHEERTGTTYDMMGCRRYFWSTPEALVIAHEIGHIFGLSDLTDEYNNDYLMFINSSRGDEITNFQYWIVHEQVRLFSICSI